MENEDIWYTSWVGFSFSETVNVLILSNTSYCITIVHAILYTCVCIHYIYIKIIKPEKVY